MPVNIGDLVAQLKLDTASFNTSLQEVNQRLDKLEEGVKRSASSAESMSGALNTVSQVLQVMGGPLGVAVGSLVELGTQGLNVVSVMKLVAATAYELSNAVLTAASQTRQLMAVSGLSATAAHELGDAFGLLGVETGTLNQALFRLGNAVEQGSPALQRLGIDVRDTHGQLKTEGDLLLEVRDRISALGDASSRNAALIQVFGRAGRELATAFGLSKEAFRDLMETAGAISPWSDEQQNQARAYGRAIREAALAWEALKIELGTGLLSVLTNIEQTLTRISMLLRSMPSVARQLGAQENLFPEGLGGVGPNVYPGTAMLPNFAQGVAPLAPGAGVTFGPEMNVGLARQQVIEAQIDATRRLGAITLDLARAQGEAWGATSVTTLQRQLQALQDSWRVRQDLFDVQERSERFIGGEEAAAKVRLARMQAENAFRKEEIDQREKIKQLQAEQDAKDIERELKVHAGLPGAEELTPEAAYQLGQRDIIANRPPPEVPIYQGGIPTVPPEVREEFFRKATAAEVDFGKQMNAIREEAALFGHSLDSVGDSLNLVTARIKTLMVAGDVVPDYLKREYEVLNTIKQVQTEVGNIFDAITSGLAGTVTGVLQGTQTMAQAFDNLGRNIALSLIQHGINEGLNVLKQQLNDFIKWMIETGLIKSLFQAGLAIAGVDIGLNTDVGTGGLLGNAAGQYGGVNVIPPTSPRYQHGGIVTFPQMALIGEAGPEAVVPLSGGGPGLVTVNVINQAPGTQADHTQSQGVNGQEIHNIVIREIQRGLALGELDRGLGMTYGLSRQPARR